METSETCPGCHHVVVLPEGKTSGKCPNCGEKVSFQDRHDRTVSTTAPPSQRAAGANVAIPHASPPGNVGGVAGGRVSDGLMGQAIPVTRSVTIVAFIFSLLFFVPFVTQAIGVVLGMVAIIRPRLKNERVALAWVGLVISIIAMSAWGFMFIAVIPAMQTTMTWSVTPYADTTIEDDWQHTANLADTMKRIYRAASAYRRDFGRWPQDVNSLAGQWLPRKFTMPEELTYRPVPEEKSGSLDWILMVSQPLDYDLDGDTLKTAHRLIIRTSGKVELLPNEEVEAMLGTSDGTTGENP